MKRLTGYERLAIALCLVYIVCCLGWLFLHRNPPAGWQVQTEREDTVLVRNPDSGVNTDGLLPGEIIDLNTATRSDLLRLPNIGATRAEAILAYRDAHGPFTHADDLLNIHGLGPTLLEQLRPYICVGQD